MSLWQNFKNSPIKTISDWQDHRFLWALMAVAMIVLVLLAHGFFQNYLYMAPCEQCVYIRYAMLVMALGGIIAFINPKNAVLKIIGYVLGIYGAIRGIMFSVKLHSIHEAVHSEDAVFGMQGCSLIPNYDFGLPLHKWAPDWFLPTGDCGYDSPIVPSGATLDSIQKFFIDLYSDGWYLFPSAKFADMAQCTLIAYVLSLIILLVMLFSWLITKLKH